MQNTEGVHDGCKAFFPLTERNFHSFQEVITSFHHFLQFKFVHKLRLDESYCGVATELVSDLGDRPPW